MIFSNKVCEMYTARLGSRLDPDGFVFYFSADDFPGLKYDPIAFKNTKGDTLKGYVYSYPNPIDDRIVVFDHGMGAGHRAYMSEINKLAEHGYRVVAYDHTGCAESDGNGILGFSGSLADLDCVITAVKSSAEYSNCKITVMGHSWGAFSTLNITALHPDVESFVAMSGFISVKSMQKEKIGGILSLWLNDIYSLEKRLNPNHYSYSALDTLASTRSRGLIIHSVDDPVVSYKRNFVPLEKACSNKENLTFITLNFKRHSPNYTVDAVRYKDEYFASLGKLRKKHKHITESDKKAFVNLYDWRKMTEQDEKTWQKIFDHIDR